MKIKGRYKLVEKRKFAQVQLPSEQVKEAFLQAVTEKENGLPLQITFDKKNNVYKIFYKLSDRKGDICENYCLLVEFTQKEQNLTEIEYAFVFDKAMSNYTKFLSAVCFVAPISALLTAYFVYDFINLYFAIPVGVIALFGLITFFGFKERADDAKPLVAEFENLLMKIFM